MAKAKKNLTERVGELEQRISKVQEVVGRADSKGEIEDNLRSAIVAKIQKDAEEAFVKSFLYKTMKWIVVAGIIAWAGGTFYGIKSIKSVHIRSEEAQKQFNVEIKKVSKAATEAISSIQRENQHAKKILDVDNLKDLEEIQKQIAALKKADGELNIAAIRTLVNNLTISLIALSSILFVMILFLALKLLLRSRRGRRQID